MSLAVIKKSSLLFLITENSLVHFDVVQRIRNNYPLIRDEITR